MSQYEQGIEDGQKAADNERLLIERGLKPASAAVARIRDLRDRSLKAGTDWDRGAVAMYQLFLAEYAR